MPAGDGGHGRGCQHMCLAAGATGTRHKCSKQALETLWAMVGVAKEHKNHNLKASNEVRLCRVLVKVSKWGPCCSFTATMDRSPWPTHKYCSATYRLGELRPGPDSHGRARLGGGRVLARPGAPRVGRVWLVGRQLNARRTGQNGLPGPQSAETYNCVRSACWSGAGQCVQSNWSLRYVRVQFVQMRRGYGYGYFTYV
jgi:hypothetical protein